MCPAFVCSMCGLAWSLTWGNSQTYRHSLLQTNLMADVEKLSLRDIFVGHLGFFESLTFTTF